MSSVCHQFLSSILDFYCKSLYVDKSDLYSYYSMKYQQVLFWFKMHQLVDDWDTAPDLTGELTTRRPHRPTIIVAAMGRGLIFGDIQRDCFRHLCLSPVLFVV